MQTYSILKYFFLFHLFLPHHSQSLLQEGATSGNERVPSQNADTNYDLETRQRKRIRKSKIIRRKRLPLIPSSRPPLIPNTEPTTNSSRITSRNPSSITTLSPNLSLSTSPLRDLKKRKRKRVGKSKIKRRKRLHVTPSTRPSLIPSEEPTTKSSRLTSRNPSSIPTFSPSLSPSTFPSSAPTFLRSIKTTFMPTSVPSVPPSSILPNKDPRVALGHFHSCVIDSLSNLKCWGFNAFGQLGDGTTTNHITPTTISLGEEYLHAAKISLGFAHSCAIDNFNGLNCWGCNDHGQLGDGTVVNRHTPIQISLGAHSPFTKEIALGAFHTCVIDGSNNLKCWGLNVFGQLGDGTTANRNTPTPISLLGEDSSYASRVSTGLAHTCAVNYSNDLQCWGRNENGQIGNGKYTNQSAPTSINLGGDFPNARKTILSFVHSCAINDSDVLKCWGDNSKGQLGDGTITSHSIPNFISLGINDAALGGLHTCVIDSFGMVKCWGDNREGQLGDGTGEEERLTPSVISLGVGSSTANKIAVGYAHTCAIDNLNNLKCWGDNSFGQLGDGTTLDRDIPTFIYKL